MTKLNDLSDENSLEYDKEELLKVIQVLRDLVSKEKHLKVRTDDNFMLRYLRCCNYNPEMALRKVSSCVMSVKNFFRLNKPETSILLNR